MDSTTPETDSLIGLPPAPSVAQDGLWAYTRDHSRRCLAHLPVAHWTHNSADPVPEPTVTIQTPDPTAIPLGLLTELIKQVMGEAVDTLVPPVQSRINQAYHFAHDVLIETTASCVRQAYVESPAPGELAIQVSNAQTVVQHMYEDEGARDVCIFAAATVSLDQARLPLDTEPLRLAFDRAGGRQKLSEIPEVRHRRTRSD